MRRMNARVIFTLAALGLCAVACGERTPDPVSFAFDVPSWTSFQRAVQAERCRGYSPVRPARGGWIAFRTVDAMAMTPRTLGATSALVERHMPAHRQSLEEAALDCHGLAESAEAQTLAIVRSWRCLVMEPLADAARRDLVRDRLGRAAIDWAHVDGIRTKYAGDPRWRAALAESAEPCPPLDVAVLESSPPDASEVPARVGRLFGDRRATFFIEGGAGASQRGELQLGTEALSIEVVPLADGVLRGQGGDVETGFRFEARSGGRGRFNGTWSLGPVGARSRGTLVIAPQPVELQSAVER